MRQPIPDRDYRIPSACGIVGIMDQSGKIFSGSDIARSIATMHERSNGLGGGFAAYGIYPDFKEHFCFHMLYDNEIAKRNAEDHLRAYFQIDFNEPIPVRKTANIKPENILWRYFMKFKNPENESDRIVEIVMKINSDIEGAFVISSGKNMGIFKGVGYPEDIAEFFKLEEYKAYTWTSHGRFPTNTSGWWGGAHPFGILDWSVVHNGEISSYGINRRYLQNFGYNCSLHTDTEVITYLFDLLVRKHELDFETVTRIIASPMWSEIERMDEERKEFYTTLRMIYSSALVNGPFGIIVANTNTMAGMTDRIKLRPLVAASLGDVVYIASEESAIREICPKPDRVWMPKAGEVVIGRLSGR